MTDFELHLEYRHDPDAHGIAVDPISGNYNEEYVEWLEKKLIEVRENIESREKDD